MNGTLARSINCCGVMATNTPPLLIARLVLSLISSKKFPTPENLVDPSLFWSVSISECRVSVLCLTRDGMCEKLISDPWRYWLKCQEDEEHHTRVKSSQQLASEKEQVLYHWFQDSHCIYISSNNDNNIILII